MFKDLQFLTFYQNEINQAYICILKIYNSFNEVTLDWLLLEEPSKAIKPLAYLDEKGEDELNDSKDETFVIPNNNNENYNSSNEVIEVIKFYKDGSFETFLPRT